MRYREFKIPLKEGARIQHAEDLVFFEGSAGARRAVEAMKQMEKDGHQDVTVKWDGSPAIIFGRNEEGDFVLTDKSGFVAKGYNGRPTSGKDLSDMLINRLTSKGKPVTPDRKIFAKNMANLYAVMEKSFDKSHIGYYKGDLLYYETPPLREGHFVFQPQLVSYAVKEDSPLGKEISRSKAGLVVHREVTREGAETSIQTPPPMTPDVLVVPPVTTQAPVEIDNSMLAQLESLISRQGAGLDRFLDPVSLRSNKLTDLPDILYRYTNSKVDTGLSTLGKDFMKWLATSSKITAVKQERIKNHILENQDSYTAMWNIVNGIMKVKDNIISQFDRQDSPVKQSMSGGGEQVDGGEGYVLAHPDGDIKLVPRQTFSRFNRMVQR